MTIHDDKRWRWNPETLTWRSEDSVWAVHLDPSTSMWRLESPYWSGVLETLDEAYKLAEAAEEVYRDGHHDGYEAGYEEGHDDGYDLALNEPEGSE